MSIGSEITRIRNAKADIISFLKENGISIPDGISIDDLNYYVEQYMAGRPTPPSNSILYTFNSAGSVTDVSFSTEKVRARQCHSLTALETVTFIYPDTLTAIGDYAFQSCTNLSSIELPSGLKSIGRMVFFKCSKLALTEIPSGITSIGGSAFENCTNLKSITFKGTPDSIESSAFNSCTKLVDIKVPWSSGAVAGAPWGATRATITYDYAPTT